MPKYSTEHKRNVVQEMKRREAEHQRRQGKQPSQREIDAKWNRIAEQGDRKGNT